MIRSIIRTALRPWYRLLAHIFYPQKCELLAMAPFFVRGYIIPQKLLNVNGCRGIPWPVHFTSKVFGSIKTGKITTPGMSPGVYINGINGVIFGDNVYIGPGAKIISANHDKTDYQKHVEDGPIEIGNDVWIGANAVILPGVSIGDNSIVGAGAVVTANIPTNCTVVGNPAKIVSRR